MLVLWDAFLSGVLHNLSFSNLKTKEGYCYIWNETEGDVNSEMFAQL
jgi:hypothetical protein